MKIIGVSAILAALLLTGCLQKEEVVHTSHPPTAAEVLKIEPDADIFQWDGVICQAGIDWVDDLELTEKEKIGEISSQAANAAAFKDGAANVLPIGTEIYSVNEQEGLYIVKDKGKSRHYLTLSEG